MMQKDGEFNLINMHMESYGSSANEATMKNIGKYITVCTFYGTHGQPFISVTVMS